MAKVKLVQYKHSDGSVGNEQYHFFCNGCGYVHALSPKVHSFNGDFDKPTFTPSVLNNFSPDRICHSFITDGKIQYLGDCFHELKGQTIELPELTDDMK